LTPSIHTNTIPDFIIPFLFKIVKEIDEEKKSECEKIVSEVLNNLIENTLESLRLEPSTFLINKILINQKQDKNIIKPDFINKITETFYVNNVKL
jgi:Tfp pilus assembly pilus retraction ATPase PilT